MHAWTRLIFLLNPEWHNRCLDVWVKMQGIPTTRLIEPRQWYSVDKPLYIYFQITVDAGTSSTINRPPMLSSIYSAQKYMVVVCMQKVYFEKWKVEIRSWHVHNYYHRPQSIDRQCFPAFILLKNTWLLFACKRFILKNEKLKLEVDMCTIIMFIKLQCFPHVKEKPLVRTVEKPKYYK